MRHSWRRTLIAALRVAAVAAAILAIAACSNPTFSSPTSASPKELVSNLISASNAKLSTLIDDSQYLSLAEVLPPGTTTPGILKVEGIPALGVQYGPVTFTKYYYQDNANSTIVGVDFSSEMPILAVYVKGGQVAKGTSGGYLYTWTEGSSTSGTELTTAPIYGNPNGLKSGISHIEFAWIPKVLASATATTSYDRQYDWSIAKANDASAVTSNSQATPFMLDPGQAATVNYSVTVAPAAIDYDFLVKGEIAVTNPSYNPGEAAISGVTAQGAALAGTPLTLAPGASATFAYSFAPTSAASGSIAYSVATTSNVGGASGGVAFAFGEPAHVYDASIAVTDSLVPLAGRTIAVGGTYSFGYSYEALATSASPAAIDNVAAFVESDSGRTGSASSTVWVQLKPASGYTRSMGYWKTHAKSSYQSRPVYDTTWDKLGVTAPFFKSGAGNIDAMWTAPAGNAYYNFSTQYLGAKLNVLTGFAPPAAVAAAIARAEYYFGLYTPAQVGAWKSNDAKRQEMIGIAGTLGAFNIDRGNP